LKLVKGTYNELTNGGGKQLQHIIIVQVPLLKTDLTGKFLYGFQWLQALVCERIPEVAGILQVRSNACAIGSEQGIGVGPTIKMHCKLG